MKRAASNKTKDRLQGKFFEPVLSVHWTLRSVHPSTVDFFKSNGDHVFQALGHPDAVLEDGGHDGIDWGWDEWLPHGNHTHDNHTHDNHTHDNHTDHHHMWDSFGDWDDHTHDGDHHHFGDGDDHTHDGHHFWGDHAHDNHTHENHTHDNHTHDDGHWTWRDLDWEKAKDYYKEAEEGVKDFVNEHNWFSRDHDSDDN